MDFSLYVGLAALAVVVVQQILKSKLVPVKLANRHPVPTNIVLSVIASIVVVWQSGVSVPVTWMEWVVLVATVSVVAAITYNQLLDGWTDLRATESGK